MSEDNKNTNQTIVEPPEDAEELDTEIIDTDASDTTAADDVLEPDDEPEEDDAEEEVQKPNPQKHSKVIDLGKDDVKEVPVEKIKVKPKLSDDKVAIPVTCPGCKEEFTVAIKRDPLLMAHDLQAMGLYPADTIFVYQVTSHQIQNFLFQKAKRYVPKLRTLLVEPLFTKSRSKKNAGPGHAYAALQIAMSAEVIENDLNRYGVFGRIGLDDNHVRLRKDMFHYFIQRYGYDRKALDQILRDYKLMEKYEEEFGMDEKYLQTLKMFAAPRQQKASDDNSYVIFAANATKIFNDMFISAHDKHNVGRIMKIVDTAQMDGGSTVMYTVHIHTSGVSMERSVDSAVKAMLRGGKK